MSNWRQVGRAVGTNRSPVALSSSVTRVRRSIHPRVRQRFTARWAAMDLPIMHRIVAARTSRWAQRGDSDRYEEARAITFDVAAGALACLNAGAEVDRMRELFCGLLHGFDPTRETRPSPTSCVVRSSPEARDASRSAPVTGRRSRRTAVGP